MTAGDRAVAGGTMALDGQLGAVAAGSASKGIHKAQVCGPDRHKQVIPSHAQSGQQHLFAAYVSRCKT